MIRINLRRPSPSKRSPWIFRTSLLLSALLLGHLSGAHELIIDGGTVKKNEYPAVFAIKMSIPASAVSDPEASPENLCTAFLVHPRLILTAAHCLKGVLGITSLTNGSNVNDYLEREIADFRAHPAYFATNEKSTDDENARAGAADIGYVLLKNPIDNVTPLEMVTSDDLAAEQSLVGKNAIFVGYGASRWESSGVYNGSSAGTKRKGEKTVTKIKNGLIYLEGEKNGVLPGDSGGPMLMEIDGALKAVAINHKKSDATKTVLRRTFPIFGKKKPVLVRDHYDASIESPLTKANLCWVERNSGVDLPGVECAN